jgi:Tfp pilus assembly protein PilZ
VSFKIGVSLGGGTTGATVFAMNVSQGGMGLAMTNMVRIGERVHVLLPVANAGVLPMEAVVCYCAAKKARSLPYFAVGVRFTALTPHAERVLRSMISAARAANDKRPTTDVKWIG